MSALILTVANMKGGVGKTTVAVSLARMFASEDGPIGPMRVLMIDLDAQANASFWVCGDDVLAELIEGGRTIDAFLEDCVVLNQERKLSEFVHSAYLDAAPISIVPSSPQLRLVEREMLYFLSERRQSMRDAERVVADAFLQELAELKSSYDIIIFDSAPGISALTEAALRASHIVIVPTVPDLISTLGLDAFCKAVWADDSMGGGFQQTPWVLANMVKDTAHHEDTLREMRLEAEAEDAGFRMFKVEIPSLTAIEEAATHVNGDSYNALTEQASMLFHALAAEVAEAAHAVHAAHAAHAAHAVR